MSYILTDVEALILGGKPDEALQRHSTRLQTRPYGHLQPSRAADGLGPVGPKNLIDAERCANNSRSPFAWHTVMENKSHRQLTVISGGGLCNRLRVLLSGLAIAEATGREFVMRWHDKSSVCSFNRLFENRWDVRPHVSIDQAQLIDLTIRSLSTFPDLLLSQADHLVVTHYDWLIRPARYPTHRTLQNRCVALMNELKPVTWLDQRVQSCIADTFRERMIGVHLRRGDLVLHRPDKVDNLVPAMQAVDRWLDASPEAGILLCTDDGAPDPFSPRQVPYEGVVEQFVQRYGARVITTKPRSLDRHTPEAIEDALIDLWLLRSTDFFVGTAGSSFSEMAMFGRTVPAVLTAAPTPAHARQTHWLKVSGIYYAMSQLGRREFGGDVPYNQILRRYKLRLQSFVRRMARRSRNLLNRGGA